MLDFPFASGDAAFTAKAAVTYFNSDKIELVSDRSWLTTEQYIIPIPGNDIRNLREPEIIKPHAMDDGSFVPDYSEWTLTIPDAYLSGLSNLYIHIDYIGDIGRCYLGHRLVSDNFNNGTYWPIALKHLGMQVENNELRFEIYPLKPDYQIYFERPPSLEDIGIDEIKNLEVIPEYAADVLFK